MTCLSRIADFASHLGRMALAVCALQGLAGTGAFAGDAAQGEALYRQCRACHELITPEGEIRQRGGQTGPNLFGILGRPIASLPDFAYSPGMTALGRSGMVWEDAALLAYLRDPSGWLQQQRGDTSLRADMTPKLRQGGADLLAYLRQSAK